MSLFDFLTDGFPPVHDKPIRYLAHWQPIGDCGRWDCLGCGHEPKHCKCGTNHDPYDKDGEW